MITVLVVDDQPLVRHAIRDILTDSGDIQLVGEASNGREAVSAAITFAPDVVLMDIRMPELDGIAATEKICAPSTGNETRVLILTTFEEDEYVVAALRAGASGFIGKGAEPDEIVRAVRTIHSGESLLSSAATKALIERSVLQSAQRTAAWDDDRLARLTMREREVLILVAAGRTNQEISAELVISPHTAKTHVNRIMSKVDARDRAQLVILAYESGLISAGA
ncbi:response regulator [Microbacterium murale]|uniref:DNA-binding NarL/FixJ family response regulator n=1 Tax=Microbacterium murale TaxID=1081040 RepID=A0ABU0PDX0_9MICO|nr:response regulator transcription factor [Microbacterium murale]MDQ0645530.1 DNA-binding NarL/FixJ family response regulator [Microbacterium murale]